MESFVLGQTRNRAAAGKKIDKKLRFPISNSTPAVINRPFNKRQKTPFIAYISDELAR